MEVYPSNNPIPGSPVWTWGHRNAQGLVLAPNGHVYSSEHGPTTDDELNLLEVGRNYGWPAVHGMCDGPSEMIFCNDSNVFEPLLNWTPTIATSDIAWYGHPSIPEFQNSILMAVLKDKNLVSIRLDATGRQVTGQKNYFNNTWGRLRDICISPDGAIYIATNGSGWSNTDPFTHSIIELKNSNHPVGIDLNVINAIRIWPQPAKDVVHIQVNQEWIGGSIELYDTTGIMTRQLNMNKAKEPISTANLPPGIYILVIKKGNDLVTKKLIIQ